MIGTAGNGIPNPDWDEVYYANHTVKAVMWKQGLYSTAVTSNNLNYCYAGRGRSIGFIRPWRERLFILDLKKICMFYYEVPRQVRIAPSPPQLIASF